MRLDDWRRENRYTYKSMSDISGITVSKLQRICSERYCVKMVDAHKIIKMTKGEVSFADLLPEDCS